ncbi:MAG TPA: GAF domain-containing protein [Bacteroidia bacterium]|nr:GAF domain-containing protein [Bacteroidia bacterium]
MAESLHITGHSKAEKYVSLFPQLKALCEGEPDMTANLANISAALKQAFGFFWVGFYIVRKNELVLGPFQGPVACTRIASGRGVCGTAWKEKKSIVVPDVEQFPGHIACSSDSKSEIVVPVFNSAGMVTMVLDVDSDVLNAFDETDEKHLVEICTWIGQLNHGDAV